ncbi:fructosamine kinase family protein [Alteromonas sp. McT4-15]|uniref:fructosamine kinase family protein n=1 Tax=Alteromonas sp. McT4-15 TaxID=2881256 RepID=UPI001CF9248D|nr:fructosamine kinase family protein [Alteromonas sp. McT4-15]MCB4436442.1 fructosamine kinase family protein [Alteromonas sp. McT4-15]
MWHFISEHISEQTDTFFSCQRADPVSGGDTHASYIIKDSTRRYFVKTRIYDDTQQLSHEAEGLQAISDTQTVITPAVICHGITKDSSPNMEYLVLSHVRFVEPTQDDYFLLGQQLASLHQVNAYTSYGWPHDNYIGANVQTNGRIASWADFYAEKRIGSMLERLASTGAWHKNDGDIDNIVSLTRNLLSLHQPHPALLHGDLWAGNAGFSKKGPVLFDPAVYVGDSETDLAMAELFGGFPSAFFDGYKTISSIEKNYEQRKPIYQLYHILNHGLLFGAHYIAQAKQTISEIQRQM